MDAVRKILSVALLSVALLGVVAGVASAAPAFPVKYSANKRYLVDQNGVPFPILGRTAWFITSLSGSDQHVFIDDTVARGHNAIEFHVLNHDPRGNNPPFSGSGDKPFLNQLNGSTWNGALNYGNIANEAPDFTTPNPAYWSFVDDLLAYCESKGILVFFFPAYVGYNGGDQGWMQEMVANGPTKLQSYGAWIAARYKNQKNLVWMMGGDMGTAPHAFNSAQSSVESALLNGLKSVSGQQSVFFSAEWDSESIATDQTSFGSSMTLNGAYSWTGAVSSHGRRAYARTSVIPAFLLEEPYDEEGADGNSYNPSATQPVRRFQWWGWLSTIGGYISGNGYVWPFRSDNPTVDWRNHLNTQGSRDMTRLNAFIGSIAWQNLVPSGLNGMRTLITSGGSTVSDAAYVAASATSDGRLLVAYVPPAHSGPITVDMGAMSGLTRARWFDPTSAVYSGIGSGLTNSGSHDFPPPGNNSGGAGDWVLVLDVPDNTKPTIRITAPTSGSALTNTTGKINLAGTAGDNVAVAQVAWSDDRGGEGLAVGTNSWSVTNIVLSPGPNLLTVTAADAAGNSTEDVLSVLYRVPPFFLQQPASRFAVTNETVIFSVTAGGDEPRKFQWRKNDANISGATNASLTLTNVTPGSSGTFSVVVANLAGSVTSSNAVLKVFTPPLISGQPLNRTVTVGGTTSFSVSVRGTTPLFYQWRQDGIEIAGATNRSCKLTSIQTNRAGLYSVVVSNFAGVRVSSNATLTVNVPPRFVVQPVAQSVIAGPTNILFTAAATGTEPLRYQWRRNGGSIAGATNTSYTVTNVTSSAYYSVFVANVAGSATSSNAFLKMFKPPAFTSQPASRTVPAGGSASFSVSVSGTPPMFFQWRQDAVEIAGATNQTLALSSIQTNHAGVYSVTASNFAGVRVSSNATLTVNVPPAFTLQPVTQSAVMGDAVTFTAAATGTAPLRFQWRKNGGNLAGATNTSYGIAHATNSSAGSYSLTVANVAGTVTSSNAVLTVLPPPSNRPAAPFAPPLLSATAVGGDLILSWPVDADGFTLQITANLTEWFPLPPPSVEGGSYVVTNSIIGPAQFYRLVK